MVQQEEKDRQWREREENDTKGCVGFSYRKLASVLASNWKKKKLVC